MTGGWSLKEFSEIAEIFNGNSISKKDKETLYTGLTDGVPYIGTKDVGFDHVIEYDNGVLIPESKAKDFKIAPANSVLVCSEGGSAGRKVAHNIRNTHFGNKLFAIVPGDAAISKYLYYYTLSSEFKESFKDLMTGVIGGVSLKKFKSIKLPVPTVIEQKRIVAMLDEAFAGIDTAIANTEKNLANARELFESYLNSVFTQQGDGWVEKKLSEVCGIVSSLIDPRMEEFIDLPHIGAGNIISKTGELIDIQTAREEGLKSGKFLFDEKMVLYSKIRPYLEKVARPDFQGLCSADMYPLMPKEGFLDRDFLYYLLLSRQFTDYAIAGSARAGMPKVNRSHLFQYTTAFPEVAIQEKLSEQLNAIEVESKRLELIYQQKLTSLLELKQSLLQKAFSGELTAEGGRLMDEAVA